MSAIAAMRAKGISWSRRQGLGFEHQNATNSCPGQLLKRIKDLGVKLGRTPNRMEMREDGICRTVLIHRFGSVAAAIKLAGMKPNLTGGNKFYTKESIKEMFINFYKHSGRSPSSSDLKRGFLPDYGTIARYFGTLPKARKAARIPQPAPRTWKTEELLSIIKNKTKIIGRMPKALEYKIMGLPAPSTYVKRFGSLSKLAIKLGFIPTGRRGLK